MMHRDNQIPVAAVARQLTPAKSVSPKLMRDPVSKNKVIVIEGP